MSFICCSLITYDCSKEIKGNLLFEDVEIKAYILLKTHVICSSPPSLLLHCDYLVTLRRREQLASPLSSMVFSLVASFLFCSWTFWWYRHVFISQWLIYFMVVVFLGFVVAIFVIFVILQFCNIFAILIALQGEFFFITVVKYWQELITLFVSDPTIPRSMWPASLSNKHGYDVYHTIQNSLKGDVFTQRTTFKHLLTPPYYFLENVLHGGSD